MTSVNGISHRQSSFRWYGVLGPALGAVAVLCLAWWQWQLPPEDLAFDTWLAFDCVAACILGLATAKTGWHWRWMVIALPILCSVWPVVLVLMIAPVILVFFVGVWCLAYWIPRLAVRHDPAWRVPLALALLPLLVANLAALPPWDSYKWLWPWVSFRAPILRFQAHTDAAADRLGLPVGRPLTKQERDAWSAATPLELRLRYPILGTAVTVSVVDPWTYQRFPDGQVWAWWGGPGRPTFGLLDVRRMHILSASD